MRRLTISGLLAVGALLMSSLPASAAEPETGSTSAAVADPCSPSAAPPAPPAPACSGNGTTAAETFKWGQPNRVEEFDGPLGAAWGVYDGPGHGGNGTRTPNAVSLRDGIMTITGDSSGATAGMAWIPGQKYGRWEARVRSPVSDPSYNSLLLLWPDEENWPVGGEIDFMEISDPARQRADIFVHYGADNSQTQGKVDVDATQWHNWAVEWTPDHIAAFVDGKEWYRTTDPVVQPPGPMHLCIQLDWFPDGGTPKTSTMEIAWVKQYPAGGAASGG